MLVSLLRNSGKGLPDQDVIPVDKVAKAAFVTDPASFRAAKIDAADGMSQYVRPLHARLVLGREVREFFRCPASWSFDVVRTRARHRLVLQSLDYATQKGHHGL